MWPIRYIARRVDTSQAARIGREGAPQRVRRHVRDRHASVGREQLVGERASGVRGRAGVRCRRAGACRRNGGEGGARRGRPRAPRRCSRRCSRSDGNHRDLRSPAKVLVASRGIQAAAGEIEPVGASPQNSQMRGPARIKVSTTVRRGTSWRLRGSARSFQSSRRRTLPISVSETPSSRASATAEASEERMWATFSQVRPRWAASASVARAAARRSARAQGRSAAGARPSGRRT